MEIILLKDIKDIGKAGEKVNVKDGYARNFVLPRKLGIEATEENVKEWKIQKAKEEAEEAARRAEAMKLKEQIEKLSVNIESKSGEGGKLFGSVTSKEISDSLKAQHKINIEKKKIELKENIRAVGTTTVVVRVYPEITADLKVVVTGK
ncbi:MAG: 50S ribosomal protein L9 [Tissierellia bacterium]|nr:50S ribosomal protein L9 [Tissierellia bacterium]